MSSSAHGRLNHYITHYGTMADHANMLEAEQSGFPPKLPPLQLMSSKLSFANLFTTAADKSVNIEEKQQALSTPTTSSALETSRSGAARSISSPQGNLHDSNRIHLSQQRAMTEAQNTAPVTLRSTSNGSSTSRSGRSDVTHPRSRPSSRSSVEVTPVIPKKSARRIYNESAKAQQKVLRRLSRAPDLSPKKSPKTGTSVRAHTITNRTLWNNKPLPPAPRNTFIIPDPLQIHKSALGSIRVTTPEPPLSKRGERLGRQMVGKTGNRPKIRTSRFSIAGQIRTKIDNASESGSEEAPSSQLHASPLVQSRYASRCILDSSSPERVLLKVLSQLDNLDDLRNVSMVNKGLYRAFKRYEKDLVSRVLFRWSQPAWELRQIMKCNKHRNAFKLRPIQRDVATIRALRSFILMKCEALCRQTTLDGLLGRDIARKAEIDNALWRIWVFCQLFGKMKGNEDAFKSQLVWLDGGERKANGVNPISLGVGNGTGLSLHELEDMSEMWSCLEAILAGFRDRENEARKVGIFDACEIDEDSGVTERALFNLWIDDILSLGPKAVLTLSSCSFEHAKVLGITNWRPPEEGKGHNNFCKSAIEYVYRERLVSEARSKALEYEKTVRSQSRLSRSQSYPPSSTDASITSLSLTSTLPALRKRPNLHVITSTIMDPPKTSLSMQPEKDIKPSTHSLQRMSQVPGTPGFSSFAMTNGASARLGATLFPIQYPNKQSRLSTVVEKPADWTPITGPQVKDAAMLDPTDMALLHLVRDRSFPEAEAKRALAQSDNGKGIDLERAIILLTNQQLSDSNTANNASELPTFPATYHLSPSAQVVPQEHHMQPSQDGGRRLLRKLTHRSPPSTDEAPNADYMLQRQISGYLHVPIDEPAYNPHNRSSLSQKFKSLRPTNHNHNHHHHHHHHHNLSEELRSILPTHLIHTRSTKPNPLRFSLNKSTSNLPDDRKPNRLWSLRDFRKKDEFSAYHAY